MTVELLRWNFRRSSGPLGQPSPPRFFGGNARCEPNLHRGQIGGIGEIEDRPDHPVDLLGGHRPQRDLADQEQVAGLVQGEPEHVAGRLAQQQIAVEPLALLLGGPHEERLHPQGAVAHGQVDADPELALAGQAQEPAPVAQLLGLHPGVGEERAHRRHRGRAHVVGFGSSVHQGLRLPWGPTTDEGWEGMGEEPMAAIQVSGLRKRYGEVEAVRGIDFEVAEGECFALLGPNGAGKTTTVEILEGYRDRDGGEVEVLGHDPRRGKRSLREQVGIVLQSAGQFRELTVREVLDLFGGYYPSPRDSGEVIDLVGLGDKAGARVKTLSGGQQRRLDLALGLVGDPDLLFLDEPTTGFDPSARRRSWELIESLRDLGKTILLTTHYMDEAQNLADRVAILAAGRVVASGTPDSLGGRDEGEAQIAFRLPAGTTVADLPPDLPGRPGPHEDRVQLRTTEPTRALHVLTTWALARGEELEALTVTRPSLEDVYLRLTGDQEPIRV